MTLRNLGKSGLRVSLVGLGCNNFGQRMDLESSTKVIHKALDAGITLFDTADVYGGRGGSETVLGQVLGERRKDIVLASKFGMAMDDGEKKGASRRYIMSAVEASLKRLKTDWIDLYQVHRPDPLTPIEETLRALDDLVRAGKVRYIGCSNFSAAADDRGAMGRAAPQPQRVHLGAGRVQPAQAHARQGEPPDDGALRARPAALFPARLRPAHRQAQARRGGGRHAAGDARQFAPMFMTDANFDKVEKLEAFVQARGRSMLELAFSWLAARPTVGQHHRGRDQARADRREREGDGLDAERRGDGGDRQDHGAA